MTEKERRKAFYSADNWSLSMRFPANQAFRVQLFEFYSLHIYELQMWSPIGWDSEQMQRVPVHPGWEHKMFFIEKPVGQYDSCFEQVMTTEIWKLMKEAEQKQKEKEKENEE